MVDHQGTELHLVAAVAALALPGPVALRGVDLERSDLSLGKLNDPSTKTMYSSRDLPSSELIVITTECPKSFVPPPPFSGAFAKSGGP